MIEAAELNRLNELQKQKDLAVERQKNDPKMVHIKQSERRVVQLFKNFYAFYDKKLEDKLPRGKTILRHISEVL
jgi:hypothetical protein